MLLLLLLLMLLLLLLFTVDQGLLLLLLLQLVRDRPRGPYIWIPRVRAKLRRIHRIISVT